jgi:myo-inositol-1(or 4)-monophosphatase
MLESPATHPLESPFGNQVAGVRQAALGYSVAVSDDLPHDWLETCEAAARAGGRELLAWRGRFQTREKGVADLVTDADLASQAAVQKVIAARFPQHAFVGEESTSEVFSASAGRLAWIVDPLDGTTNYVHGYPHYAVSVGLARGNELLVGVIFDPIRDQCFSASAGQGAWLNGQRLRVSGETKVSESLVAVSLPARVRHDSPDLLDFNQAVQVCQAVRRSGSAALNLAYVAAGSLDAFWANQIQPWDVAAGVLLVREAGGVVIGRNGGEFELWNPHFVSAASRDLSQGLLAVLTPFAG